MDKKQKASLSKKSSPANQNKQNQKQTNPLKHKPQPVSKKEFKKAPYLNLSPEKVVETVGTLGKKTWYGLYLMNNKLGYYNSDWQVETRDDKKKYVINLQKMHVEMKNLKGIKKFDILMKLVYQGFGKGILLEHLITQITPFEKKKYILKYVEPGVYSLDVISSSNNFNKKATKYNKKIKGERGGLGESELALILKISQGPSNWNQSKTWKMRKFFHSQGKISEELLKIDRVGKTVLSGVKTDIYYSTMKSFEPQSSYAGILNSSGVMIKGAIGSFIIKKEDAEVAKNIGIKQDIGYGIMIGTKLTGFDHQKTKELKLQIKGPFPQVKFFNDHRYNLKKLGKEKFVLTLKKDKIQGLELNKKKLPNQFKKYLVATHSIESNNTIIKELARKAVGQTENPVEQVKRLTDFVKKYVTDKMWYDFDSAVHVAKARKGDCTEHSLLMVALLRSLGIPARRVGGVGFIQLDKSGFGYHMWVQVYLGKWIDVDPTWGQFPADPSHIIMGSANEFEWIGAIGNLEITQIK
ncbi:MAG: transglutaminase-like domain-containing protein [Deltaproteobacteria bacterium]|nr:transglutaminase-like domain-containing protein [Deltaproteobacteria bacterium]